METSLEVGLMIIARGNLAIIKKVLPDAKFEVQNRRDQSVYFVTIDEIELINNCNIANQISPEWTNQLNREFVVGVEHAELAQLRFQVVQKFKAGQITAAIAAFELNVSKPRIYQLSRRFDESLGVMSLLGIKRGRKDGAIMNDLLESIIQDCIKRFFKGKNASATMVHREVLQACSEKGLAPPSLNTVKRRIKKLSPFEQAKAVHGAEYARDRLGLKPGKTPVERPLQQVQIDHTLVDVFVIDETTGKEPIRPWLTVVVDSYTRIILGFYLSLDAPSAISVAAALTMACIPKTDYLKRIGADSISYPFYGKPELIFVDNAAEFRSPKFVKALSLNNIRVDWRPIGQKHWGGIVERLIGTLMGKVHFLPGTTYSNAVQRRGTSPEKDSVLTFPMLLHWFALQIEQYHNTQHRGLNGRSPANVWYGSFKDASGGLRYPPLINDPFKFRLSFMPEEDRSITSRGIQLKRQFYSSPALSVYVGRRNVSVKYDPYSMKKIWAYIDGDFIEATYDITKPDMTLTELNQLDRYPQPESWLSPEKNYLIKKESDAIVKASKKHQRKRKAYNLANQYSAGSSVRPAEEETSSVSEADFVPSPFKVEE